MKKKQGIPLTDKQRRFAEEYVIDLKSTSAAIRAGYSKSSAGNQASMMMAKPHIREHIDRLIRERSERTGITQDRVLRELGYVAFSNIDDYEMGTSNSPIKVKDGVPRENIRAVSRVKVTVLSRDDEAGLSLERMESQLWDKTRALQLCMRHLGMLNDKLQVDVNLEMRKVIEEQAHEYDRDIARIAARKETQ